MGKTIESGQQTCVIRQITTLQEEQMDIPEELFKIYKGAVRLVVINPLNGEEESNTLYDPKDYPSID